ncbi:MAG: phosphoribosylformylglycinamidine synthase subunit PurL [Candidatus Brocadiia bacterium]
MIYHIEVATKPGIADPLSESIRHNVSDFGIKSVKNARFVQVYVVDAELAKAEVDTICKKVLADPIIYQYKIDGQFEYFDSKNSAIITVFLKPGVMDPVEASALQAIKDLGYNVRAVKTGRKYHLLGKLSKPDLATLSRKVMANEVIENIFFGHHKISAIPSISPYQFQPDIRPIMTLNPEALVRMSHDLHLSLDDKEMETIQDHYQTLGRNPTGAELETIAQTWSEHCKHKTLMGMIEFNEVDEKGRSNKEQINNLLKNTVMKATNDLNKPWCISVFKDNAGIIEFDANNAVCFKVETHNHPSAIEPYGGSGTGIGGVIRDCMGVGLGARPIFNTDIFCFAAPDLPMAKVPRGVLHPRRLLKGVVGGVRDYGNRMGIPTVNGALYFDQRYIGNPLVYCGTVGIMPRNKCFKHSEPGDLILVAGGRTGRDGIHGVTFASIELTEKSEMISSGAVQIGNAITEKKLLDTILQARDRGLYSAITDCGGGGLSSAIGEMAERPGGAIVDLGKIPLKYEGLSPTEIWISEAQERMVLSVPRRYKDEIIELFHNEDVDATFIGEFTSDKKLILKYGGNEVANIDMDFLHNGLPKFYRKAEWHHKKLSEPKLSTNNKNLGKMLKTILGMWNVCSKESIIRQYDHEVQGASAIKSMTGVKNDGPGDAYAAKPVFDSYRGVIVSNGMNPKYGDIDPYHMAASAIDEALRNIVAVGGDIRHTALLDNFCWGNTNNPEQLGGLVKASKACHDIAYQYETPFISGKDSLNNEYRASKTKSISIPSSLLISAISVVEDVRKLVTMDFKEVDNLVYLIGRTKNELGGSHYYAALGHIGNTVPRVDALIGRKIMLALHETIKQGYVRSCHDLSEGGLAVAAAEAAFAGDIGIQISLTKVPLAKDDSITRDDIILFSESNSRFIVEINPKNQQNFERLMADCPFGLIGKTIKDKKLKISGVNGKEIINEPLIMMKNAWQSPLSL